MTDAAGDPTSEREGLLGPRLELPARRRTLAPSAPLYSTTPAPSATEATTLTLRPFAEFDSDAAMRVWLPTAR